MNLLSEFESEYYEEELRKIFGVEEPKFLDFKEKSIFLVSVLLNVLNKFKIILKKIRHEDWGSTEFEEEINNFKTYIIEVKTALNFQKSTALITYLNHVLPAIIHSHFFTALQRVSIEIVEACQPYEKVDREKIEIGFNQYKEKFSSIFNLLQDYFTKPSKLKLFRIAITSVEFQSLSEKFIKIIKNKSLLRDKEIPLFNKNPTPSPSIVVMCPLIKNGIFSSPSCQSIRKITPVLAEVSENLSLNKKEDIIKTNCDNHLFFSKSQYEEIPDSNKLILN